MDTNFWWVLLHSILLFFKRISNLTTLIVSIESIAVNNVDDLLTKDIPMLTQNRLMLTCLITTQPHLLTDMLTN